MSADKEDWDADFADSPAPKVKLSLPPVAGESSKPPIHKEDDSENWDADFGDGPKPGMGSSKERHSSSNPSEASESENWDADFEGGPAAPAIQIKGRTADRLDINATDSEWTADFAWEDDPKKPSAAPDTFSEKKIAQLAQPKGTADLIASKRPTFSLAGPVTTSTRIIALLKETLPAVPELDVDRDAFLTKHKTSLIPALYQLLDPPLSLDDVTGFDAAVRTRQSELEASQASSDPTAEAAALHGLAKLHSHYGKYAQAQRFYADTLRLIEARVPLEKKSAPTRLEVLMGAAFASEKVGALQNAEEHLQHALDLATRFEMPSWQARVNHELGVLTFDKTMTAAAFFHAQLKILIAEQAESTNWRALGRCCLHLAELLHRLKTADVAEKYARRALECAIKAEDGALFALAAKIHATAEKAMAEMPQTKEIEIDKSTDDAPASEMDWGDDWDQEIGVDRSAATVLQLPAASLATISDSPSKSIVAPSSSATPAPVVAANERDLLTKYKLIQNDVEIIKYPMPSLLYSLRAAEGHRLYNEEKLEEWLTNLISKHAQKLSQLQHRVLEADALRKSYSQRVAGKKKVSVENLEALLELCHTMYVGDLRNAVWDTLVSAFDGMKSEGPSAANAPSATGTSTIGTLLFHLLYLAARLWRADVDSQFQSMVQTSLQLLTGNKSSLADADTIELLRLETLGHHKQPMTKAFSDLMKKQVQLGASANTELYAAAIIDWYFSKNSISPLNTALREYKGIPFEPTDPHDDEAALLGGVLQDKLYEKLPLSFLKAKAAYALGHYCLNALRNYQVAERLFFECIYILDRASLPNPGMAPIISELGSNALLQYAEVLLYNYKYKYAILAFSGCLATYNLRRRKEYFNLLHRMAQIAADNNDNRRAVRYYNEILQKYIEDKKTSEIIYVSEIMCKIFWDNGEFRLAEDYLRDALALLPQPAENTRMDARVFQLQLKLATVYSESSRFERAIEVLEKLLQSESQLPAGKAPLVFSLLAQVYTRKGWHDDCSQILKKLEVTELAPPPKTRGIQTAMGSLATQKANRFWELVAMNHYHAGRYPDSLQAIENAIRATSDYNLSSMGRYMYIRGKIFQQLASSATQVNFPTTLRPEGESSPLTQHNSVSSGLNSSSTSAGSPNSSSSSNSSANAGASSVVLTCTGDLLQEAVASFSRAYNFFRAVGDDMRVGKTVAHIAETYLDRLFAPVALLHLPYESVAKLAGFKVSAIVAEKEIPEKNPSGSLKAKQQQPAVPELKPLEDVIIALEDVENPAVLGLELACDSCSPFVTLKSYLNLAELRFLQKDPAAALTFWKECVESLQALFMDGVTPMGKLLPPKFYRKLSELFKRAVRFMFCFGTDLVNKNLHLIDSYLMLQVYATQAYRRSIQDVQQPVTSVHRQRLKTSPLEKIPKDAEFPLHPPRKDTIRVKGSLKDLSAGAGTSTDSPEKRAARSAVAIAESADPARVEVTGEETAEVLWGILHSMKTNAARLQAGKLAPEDLRLRNQRLLQQMVKTSQAAKLLSLTARKRDAPIPAHPSFGSPRGSPRGTNSSSGPGAANSSAPIPAVPPSPSTPRAPGRSASFRDRDRGAINTALAGGSPAGGGGPVNRVANNTTVSSSTAESAKPFDRLLEERKAVGRLLYVLSIDEYVLYYCPSRATFRVHRMGGKEESLSLGLPIDMLHLNVSLRVQLASLDNEFVTLLVNSSVTPDAVVRFLIERAASAVTPEVSKIVRKKTLGAITHATGSSSNTPSGLSAVVASIKVIDQTRGFNAEFAKLIAGVPPSATGATLAASGGNNSARSGSPALGHKRQKSTGGATEKSTISKKSFGASTSGNPAGASTGPDTPGAVRIALTPTRDTLKPLLEQPLFRLFTLQQMQLSSDSKPLPVFLHVVPGDMPTAVPSGNPSATASASAEKSFRLPELVLGYLHRLVTTPLSEKITDNPEELTEVLNTLRNSFWPLSQVWPPAPTEDFASQAVGGKSAAGAASSGFFSSLFGLGSSSSTAVSAASTPESVVRGSVTLVTNQSLSVIPWELLVSEPITRALSLHHLLLKDERCSVPLPHSNTFPAFYGCLYSAAPVPVSWEGVVPTRQTPSPVNTTSLQQQLTNYIPPTEDIRKEWLIRNALYSLHLMPKFGKPASGRAISNGVFTNPIVKSRKSTIAALRKKFPYLAFVDMCQSDNRRDIAALCDPRKMSQYPVFLLTFADLLGADDVLLFILTHAGTMVFMPEHKMRSVTARLMKLQETHIKQNPKPFRSSRDIHVFLSRALVQLQDEERTPLVLLNATL